MPALIMGTKPARLLHHPHQPTHPPSQPSQPTLPPGHCYAVSGRDDYPDLVGKLRPSGEMVLGGGTSGALHKVFDTLRRLDEAVLVQLFKAYDA